MTGEERRSQILETIKQANEPLSGARLARQSGVSRQVIVQDIALLRAAGYLIISTTKGYVLTGTPGAARNFHVRHEDDQIREELFTIVDLGGHVIDVFVDHAVYGNLRAGLNLFSRRDVEDFLAQIEAGTAKPLLKLTQGEHWHTIEASSTKLLDIIEQALREKGFLVED